MFLQYKLGILFIVASAAPGGLGRGVGVRLEHVSVLLVSPDYPREAVGWQGRGQGGRARKVGRGWGEKRLSTKKGSGLVDRNPCVSWLLGGDSNTQPSG